MNRIQRVLWKAPRIRLFRRDKLDARYMIECDRFGSTILLSYHGPATLEAVRSGAHDACLIANKLVDDWVER